MLARALDAAGMTDSTIAAYERYLVTPSPFTWPDEYVLARAYPRLGEVYDAKGNSRRAVRYYPALVDLWKNADPELQPKVALARAWQP